MQMGQQMPEKQINEIASLTDSYAKTRKSYGIFAAILLAWELIGIVIGEASSSGLKITLKSPEAIPFILLILVVYFALRFWIEWNQNNLVSKQNFYARFDYFMAHTIGAASISIWVIQFTLKSQLYSNEQFPFLVFMTAVLIFIAGLTRLTLIAKPDHFIDPNKKIEPVRSMIHFLRYIVQKKWIMLCLYWVFPVSLAIVSTVNVIIGKTSFIVSILNYLPLLVYSILILIKFPSERNS